VEAERADKSGPCEFDLPRRQIAKPRRFTGGVSFQHHTGISYGISSVFLSFNFEVAVPF
jgi:hypothetical protein